MNNFFFTYFIYFTIILLLSSFIIFISNRGVFGNYIKNYFNYNSLFEYIIIIIITSGMINFILSGVHLYLNADYLNISMVADNQQDPVRWWGVPQTWGVIGAAALAYRGTPGSPRAKILSVGASLGVTIPIMVFNQAIENPNGFNRLLYSWVHYKQHGVWPADIPQNIDGGKLADTVISESTKNASSYLPLSNKNNDGFIFDGIIPENILELFRPVQIEGYLDDLIGQQLFIHFLLLIIVFSLIILFSLYLFTQVLLGNKEFLLKKFNNRFIKFYIKYQLILAKISSIILPVFIMLGLIELFVGVLYIILHPIPFENLPIDLHIFIEKSK